MVPLPNKNRNKIKYFKTMFNAMPLAKSIHQQKQNKIWIISECNIVDSSSKNMPVGKGCKQMC